MSDESLDNINQRSDQEKPVDGLAESIKELNDQLQQLGQLTQNFASQGFPQMAQQAMDAAEAKRAELRQLEAQRVGLESGAGHQGTAPGDAAHLESRLSGYGKEAEAIERGNVARQGAVELEHELSAHAGRATSAAARFTAEEEASAISRARMLRFTQMGGGMAGMESMAGVAAAGEGGSMLGALGGPVGIGAMVAAQAAGAAIEYVQGTAQDHRLIEAQDKIDRANDKSRLDRLAGADGTAAEARQEAMAARADYAARAASEAELQEKAKPHWWKPSESPLWALNKTLGWDLKTREGQKAIEENDKAKERDLENEVRAKQIAKKKFKEDEAPLIEAQGKRNAGDERGAKALEDKAAWMRTYNELLKNGADFWQAEEGASAKVYATQKAEHQARAQSYARLVSARDGAADTARVATAAHEGVLVHSGATGIEQLRRDMNRNHAEASHAATRKHFSRP